MKKTIKLFCLSVIILSLFTFFACTPSNSNNNDNNDSEIENNIDENNDNNIVVVVDDVNDISEKISMSYMGINTNDPDIKEYSLVFNHLQDKFNIELEFSPIGAEDKDNIDILVAADNLPDCGWVYSGVNKERAINYYTSGVIRSIPTNLVTECCPNFSEMLTTSPANHLLHLAPDKDDEYYCFFANRYGFDKMGYALVMRYDWLQNLNIPEKGNVTHLMDSFYVTDEAYTIDEFEDIMYEFTFSDPDMNAENDTLGFLICKPVIWDHGYASTIMSAYGLSQYYNDDGTGWGVPVKFSPQAKKGYLKINEWIELGIVPQDLYTSTWADYDAIWASGTAGSCSHMISNFVSTSTINSIKISSPEVTLLCAPGLIDNDGSGGSTMAYEEFEFTPSAGFFFVSSKVQDEEKLKRILMFYDYLCVDTDGVVFCNYGEEGVNFKRDNLFDIIELDQSDLPIEQQVLWDAYSSPGIPKGLSGANAERPNLNSTLYAYSLENWPAVNTGYIIAPVAADVDLTIEWYSRPNKKAVLLAESEFIEKTFTGASNIETEWDNLMNVLDELGYEGYLTEINTHGLLDSEYRLGNEVHPTDIYPTH